MGNYFVYDNDLNKDYLLEKIKNLSWEMKEEIKKDESKVKHFNMVSGSSLQDLGWEIDREVITEHEYINDKLTELCTTNFDIILGSSSVTDMHVLSTPHPERTQTYIPKIYCNKMSVPCPLFLCLVNFEKIETVFNYKKKIKFYGLRFKRTEKFLKDCEDIKAGKKSFSHENLNYSSGFVGIKI